MSWIFKKREFEEFLTSKEFQQLEKKQIEISAKLELLEINYRLLAQKIKIRIGKLPSEEENQDKKDFYSSVCLPE